MTRLTSEQKASHFRAIVARRERMSGDWQLTPEGEGILARLIPSHPLEPVLTFDVNADRNDIAAVAAMPDDIDFLIASIRDLGRQVRDLQPKPKKAPDYAAECGMKCSEPLFQTWLFEVHGLENPDHVKAGTKVRLMLDIKSRADLNTDPSAAARWRKMAGDFDAWARHRRKA